MATFNPSTASPSPTSRPAIYHTSLSAYASSLSSRKSKHRNLILHDRRISQYRALLKFKTVKFHDAELDALRNLGAHVECEKALRKKVQETRWRCEEELREAKNQAKENEEGLRKELDMRIGNQRVVHRDNEKLLGENAILKDDIVAWEKENDKIMETNEVLVEELKVSNEDNEELMLSIEDLSKEVNDLQKQLKKATPTYSEALEALRKWNKALTKQNEVFVKNREEMIENDAQREVVLHQMQEELQARDGRIKWLEEAEKDVVLKKMRDEMQVKDERMNFLVESEQERLNQLRGMRRERDGLPECGCVTPRCTCEEGGYKADDDMMEWIRQNGGETNRESDNDYDADNTSDDCESEDYESEYESVEEDSEWEEGEAIRSLPAATAKLNDHIETWMEDALVEEKNSLKETEEHDEQEGEGVLPTEAAKLKDEVVMPRKDALANEENNLKEDEEDAELKEELEMVVLPAEIANREAYLAKKKYNSLKYMAERRLLAETQQKAQESKEAELKSKRLQPDNDELETDTDISREGILAKEDSNLMKDAQAQLLLVEAHRKSEPGEKREAEKSQGMTPSSVFTNAVPIESDRDHCDLTSTVIKADIVSSIDDAPVKEDNNLLEDIKEPTSLASTDKEAQPSTESETPTKFNKPPSSSSIFTPSTTTTIESALDYRHLTPSIVCAPTPASSVSSSEKKAAVGLLREKEENEAREASRKWWLEEQARARSRRDEAEKKRLADEAEESSLSKKPDEEGLANDADDQRPASEAEPQSPPEDKKKKKKKNKPKKKAAPDPNAPQKPLAPFIFYMQTARLIIASDLGGLSPQDPLVDAEGQKRWKEMAEDDKKLWISAYTDNLALYNARVHAYRNGFANAADWSDLQAIQHAERNNVEPLPGGQLFLVNELSKEERKMVKSRMREQDVEMRERAEWDRNGRERRRAPDGTWIEAGIDGNDWE